jgi:Arc/MetJ family transcription regulator
VCMSRTNIEIDDELIAEAMRKYGLKTKKEAVDLALRRLVGPRLSPEFIASLEGSGWEGDLDEMRRSRIEDLGPVEGGKWS